MLFWILLSHPVDRLAAAGELPPGAGSFYKTRLCHMFEQTGRCSKGSECRYAHGAQELRTAGAPCSLRHCFTLRCFPLCHQHTVCFGAQ